MTTSDSPTVTVLFKGLLLFAFDQDNRFCQAGIINADRHSLKITVNSNSSSLVLPNGSSFEVPAGDVLFEVPGRPRAVGTFEASYFDRDGGGDPKDFRWVIDMEGSEFHDCQVPFNTGQLERNIFILNGDFYTHATELVTLKKPAPNKPRSPYKVARTIGCRVHLKDGEEAILRYGDYSADPIRLKNEPGVKHEIVIENLCFENGGGSTLPDSDFQFYYRVIALPECEQIKLVGLEMRAQPNSGSIHPSSTSVNPCDPVKVGRTKALLPGTEWRDDFLASVA
ncbi:MAG TPA: hypothetical protein VJ302_15030 [Blastocatellia bacterium]|nr:hypothetical protein [Blastocatellia bacterium]